jgi:hypothetical protein
MKQVLDPKGNIIKGLFKNTSGVIIVTPENDELNTFNRKIIEKFDFMTKEINNLKEQLKIISEKLNNGQFNI